MDKEPLSGDVEEPKNAWEKVFTQVLMLWVYPYFTWMSTHALVTFALTGEEYDKAFERLRWEYSVALPEWLAMGVFPLVGWSIFIWFIT